ncbi:hypothetical protein ACIQNK_35965 [Streptomyces sp. NPDC091273]|uniref:hypothetical protein n=1 Tax=Streptomyces sp. NPDC091273 TaxID=3365982 RepID=UPI0037F28E8B
MTDYVKHLPTAGIPEGGVRGWGVEDARRWLRARVPAAFAPVAGGRLLAGPVLLAIVLTALGDAEPERGEDWRGYTLGVLLIALPVFFRHLPVAALLAAPVIAADAALALAAGADAAGAIGRGLVLALSAWAFTGALVRLLARRRQRELALAAAGSARFPLPEPLPAAHRRRGRTAIGLGSACCLGAAAALTGGVLLEARASGSAHPYDPWGLQMLALVLLVPGTTVLGRGLARRRAARRLSRRPQPALLVGVRISASGHHWIHPDAETPAGPPLIAQRPQARDILTGRRILLSGAERTLRREHHDIDARAEPFQAVVYGAVHEGAEVVLASAVYEGGARLVPYVTAASLLPHRRHGLGGWKPAGRSYREAVREAARLAEERRRERERERKESRSPDSAAGGCGGGCGDGGGCGGGCGGCGCG